MKNGKVFLLMSAALIATGAASAQQSDTDREVHEVEARQAEIQREHAEVEQRMREAEQRLAEAAQQIAELSTRQLPRVAEIERRIMIDGKPMLGITIEGDEPGAAAGVRVIGVTPGGAAEKAGLRSGDTITALNGESMAGDSSADANRKLLDFMSGVEVGDVLKVDYLRDGKTGHVQLEPQLMSGHVFAFGGPEFDFTVPVAPMAPGGLVENWAWVSGNSGFGDMELVSLTERLGRYFGTDKGLLVVRAPDNEKFKLQDGDVIQSIDGREPTSVSHAMRILGSYQGGEKLEIEIMRDKKKQKLSIDMPDNRQSRAGAYFVPRDVQAPVPVAPVAPVPRVKDRVDERT